MFKNKLKLNRKRNGAIMVFVLIIFLVIAIFSSTVSLLFSSNLKMAKHQENNMEAHYLLESGIDIALATLLNPLYAEGVVDKSIIDKIKKDNVTTSFGDTIDFNGKIVNITVSYVKDSKEISIKSSTELESGETKELSLKLEFSGDKFKTRWD